MWDTIPVPGPARAVEDIDLGWWLTYQPEPVVPPPPAATRSPRTAREPSPGRGNNTPPGMPR